jgi:hypothetical protein
VQPDHKVLQVQDLQEQQVLKVQPVYKELQVVQQDHKELLVFLVLQDL